MFNDDMEVLHNNVSCICLFAMHDLITGLILSLSGDNAG